MTVNTTYAVPGTYTLDVMAQPAVMVGGQATSNPGVPITITVSG